jgi:hypothetical protein
VTFTAPPLISGHGGFGIGIFSSRLISNSHVSFGLLQSCGFCVTVNLFSVLSRQPSYAVLTATSPPFITGHGGIMYGILRSRLISNEQFSFFVMSNVPVACVSSVVQEGSCFVVTATSPALMSGHGGTGSNAGHMGGWQS